MKKQYEIPTNDVADEFRRCWQEAGRHITKQVGKNALVFFRAHLNPPFLEHLSFRIGNQIFFVHITDDENTLSKPSTLEATMRIAEIANGIPCVMKMQRNSLDWEPMHIGWGLTHAISNEDISPLELVSEEKIEISDWELQDFAVQIIRNHIEENGNTVYSWCSYPEINPQIWYVDDEENHYYVIVRAVRYPASEAELPSNIAHIIESCKHKSNTGYFASISVSNAEQDPSATIEKRNNLLLWRGHGMLVNFNGLLPLDQTRIQ